MTAMSRLALRRGPRDSLIHTAALLSSHSGPISNTKTYIAFFVGYLF